MFRKLSDEAVQRLAEELKAVLTENGERDLRSCRLADLEAEVLEASTRVARATLNGTLADQARQVPAAACCPACRGPLEAKPPQTKTLKTQAGVVRWKQTVQRCPACRRDFFPSGPGIGL